MQFLSQRDLRWASDKLGDSDLTVGRWGCTTTAISMLSDYFGCYKSPREIAAHKDWYTKGGLVIWKKLDFEKMSFYRRDYGENRTAILNALADPDKAVILQVNDGAHWVAAYSKGLLPNDYVVIDPWTGKKCYAKRTYKNLTGTAFFARKKPFQS